MTAAKPGSIGDRGFSLVEVLVATAIMAAAFTSLVHVLVVSTKANTSAKVTTTATLLAVQKIEHLRALAWGFDNLGQPISDTTSDGGVDYVDANGTSLGQTPPQPPGSAAFVRRWSIEPLPGNPDNTLVLQVLVSSATQRSGPVRLVTVKTRKAM